ncbi:hypothetical protein D9M70_528260 [compost metagenome]
MVRAVQGRVAIAAQYEKRDRSFIACVRDREPAVPLQVHVQHDGVDFRLLLQQPQCPPDGWRRTNYFAAGIDQGVLDRHGHQHLVFDDKDPASRQYPRHGHSPLSSMPARSPSTKSIPIVQVTPSGSNRRSTGCPSSLARPRSRTRSPKPCR